MLCRHCGQFNASRPRGLCWVCFYTPGIRARYLPATVQGRRTARGHGARDHPSRPPRPTTAPPLTLEKLAVQQARAAAGEALHHPADARLDLR